MDKNISQQNRIPFAQCLILSLMGYYCPADTLHDSDDMKTTKELIEEMDPIQDNIAPEEVNMLMEANGFKLHYTGDGYVWMLKNR